MGEWSRLGSGSIISISIDTIFRGVLTSIDLLFWSVLMLGFFVQVTHPHIVIPHNPSNPQQPIHSLRHSAPKKLFWNMSQSQRIRATYIYPLGNKHSYWKWPFIVTFPVKMVIFHSYVSLPEGNRNNTNVWHFLGGVVLLTSQSDSKSHDRDVNFTVPGWGENFPNNPSCHKVCVGLLSISYPIKCTC